MNNLVIPSILAATVLVAGMFAVMPVTKASAVHTTILSTLCKALFGTSACPTTATPLASSNVTGAATPANVITNCKDVLTALNGTGFLKGNYTLTYVNSKCV